MKSFIRFSFFIFSLIGFIQNLTAQNLNQYVTGHLSGSFENNSQFYMKDEKIGALTPPDLFGSNSYLKLDYNYGKFSAGIQFESYLPSTLGYFPIPVSNGNKIVNKYFKYSEDKFSIQVGDFYEQFGSGLIYRSYENRQIGINNALEGFNIHVNPTEGLQMKIIYGRTRKIFDYSNSVTRGLDMECQLNSIFKISESSKIPIISVGGSYVGRYEEYAGPNDNFPATVNAYSGRMDISSNNFALNSEYVVKGSDPHLLNNLSEAKGKALLINGSFTKNNFGASLSFRSIYNMDFMSERDGEFASIAPVNYVPALTKQHDYLTSNIYIYAAQVKGESGFQTDLFYHLKPGTKIGGKYGTKIALNASMYQSVGDSLNLLKFGDKKYFSDINLEIKKKWNKKLETTLGLQKIFYNASIIQAVSEGQINANIIALGTIYKITSKKSIRTKFEHLFTQQDKKNWVSGLAEISWSSPYALYCSDLYNYGDTKNHYYNVGASVTKNSTRFALGFGKQRAGLFCVGGVCRFVPASYGFSATLTTSFSN